MISDIPIKGAKTIYAYIGDVFAWLCIVGFLILLGLSLFNRKRDLYN